MSAPTDSPAAPLKCGSCKENMSSPLVCQCCQTINPIRPGTDHFSLFGLPRKYDLDSEELHRRFLSLTRDIHPDFFATSSEQSRNLTTRMSAEINEAYNMLRDPLLRGEYILQLSGGKRSADDKRVPGDLLMEVMELREGIAEAKSSSDEEALGRIAVELSDRHRNSQEVVGRLAEQAIDQPTPELLDELRLQLNAMKYVTNLLDHLNS